MQLNLNGKYSRISFFNSNTVNGTIVYAHMLVPGFQFVHYTRPEEAFRGHRSHAS